MGKDKAFQFKARVVENKKAKGHYWRCVLSAPQIAAVALPGQFIQVRIEDNRQSVFLRRPFSIFGTRGANLTILYQVVGSGTEVFSAKKRGAVLDIIGPLGNGFEISPKEKAVTRLMVAGGIGVAPLFFLAKRLAEAQGPKSQAPNIVLLGAKTKDQILCEKDFKDYGYSVKIATDDGSRGFKGYVSGLLKQELLGTGCRQAQIYACGPQPLLKEVAIIGKRHRVPAQVSLEAHMACGIGACLGCVVNTKTGLQRVCKEGPVFMAEDIVW